MAFTERYLNKSECDSKSRVDRIFEDKNEGSMTERSLKSKDGKIFDFDKKMKD